MLVFRTNVIHMLSELISIFVMPGVKRETTGNVCNNNNNQVNENGRIKKAYIRLITYYIYNSKVVDDNISSGKAIESSR